MPQEQALMECLLSLLVSVPNFSMFSSANSVVLVNVYKLLNYNFIRNLNEGHTLVSPRIMSRAIRELFFNDLAIVIISSASLSCMC